MTIKFKFNTGQKVKCIITGMEGIIDSAAYWINGCKRYSVKPRVEKGETTMPDGWWIDEEQLELVDAGVIDKITPTPTGGPVLRNKAQKS